MEQLRHMSEWATDHLLGKLYPFWKNLRDDENGGFYGYVSYDLKTDTQAFKGCILMSRITWFFSNIFLLYKEGLLDRDKFGEYGITPEEVLDLARHGYRFITEKCIDRENGGIFWSVDCKGNPEDTTKHTYNQAFCVYALSSYFDASGDMDALEAAIDMAELIEAKCRDDKGYLEAQSREFGPEENDKLSENGVMADRTMNTLLHVFEAYTELYRVSGSPYYQNRIAALADDFVVQIYEPELHRLGVFFNDEFETIIDLHSFGHDIEAAWLIEKGCRISGYDFLAEKTDPMIKDLTETIFSKAFDGRSLPAESENGIVNERRDWWVQAEAVLGFLNGYLREEREEYLDGAIHELDFIKEHVFDKRNGSEWFYRVDKGGDPDTSEAMVEEWKCPYHNGRMCMELIRANATGML
ncbi:MAG: AGE family epimerase/isomerase [Lachnospiraceae bacterium]|nr:AGE family epimerase/isomerase [Lachnospiraceae bacterium]